MYFKPSHQRSAATCKAAVGNLLSTAAVSGGSYSKALQKYLAQSCCINKFCITAAVAAAGMLTTPAKAASLLYHWDFNSLNDSVGSAPLTLFGGASLLAGQLELPGGAARTNYASIPIDSIWPSTPTASFEGWFTMDALQNWSKVWMFGTAGAEPALSYIDWTPYSGATNNPPSISINTTTATEVNTRGGTDPAKLLAATQYHTVVVYDSGVNLMSIYLNGTLADSATMGGFNLTQLGITAQSLLGAAVNFGDPDLDGRIDDFRVFSGTLNAAQVSALNTLGVNATNAQITSIASPQNKTWSGGINSTWDTTTANFTSDTYVEGNTVKFADVDGNGAAVTRRTITIKPGGVSPLDVSVDNSTAPYTFIGSIKTAALTKTGTDSATLGSSGDAADNTGLSAIVKAGSLILAKDSSAAVHAVTNLEVSAGATARLAGTGGNQILDSGNVLIDGTLDLNGKSEAIGTLNDTGATGGIVTNGGPAASPSTLTIGTTSGTGTFNGTIQDGTGSVTLIKTGASTQNLSGFNLYTGGTTINGGVLAALSDTAFGPGRVTVNAGGTAEGNDSRSISNNFVLNGGTLSGQNGSTTYAGTVTLMAPSTINTGAGRYGQPDGSYQRKQRVDKSGHWHAGIGSQ